MTSDEILKRDKKEFLSIIKEQKYQDLKKMFKSVKIIIVPQTKKFQSAYFTPSYIKQYRKNKK